MSEQSYEGWAVIFNSGTDYEADIIRDRLDDAGIPAVVLTQRDHAFNLTMGDLAQVRVLVPQQHVEAAKKMLESMPPTDEELDKAALTSHEVEGGEDTDAIFDSGSEKINLSVPPEEDEE